MSDQPASVSGVTANEISQCNQYYPILSNFWQYSLFQYLIIIARVQTPGQIPKKSTG